MLRSGRLDGVVVRLVEDSAASDALLAAISSARVPCVCLERPADTRFGFGSVGFDDERGAFAAGGGRSRPSAGRTVRGAGAGQSRDA